MDFKQFLNEGSKPKVKLKKYKWNEPVPEKRTWDDSDYDMNQVMWISRGRGTDDDYGNIDDLGPYRYEADQMRWISRGRGSVPEYGNIDDLDPEQYDEYQMLIISRGRGSVPEYGNIDDLDPKNYDSYDMNKISMERAKRKDPKWLPE